MATPDRQKSDKQGMVIACPECDKAGDVYRRHHTNTHVGDPDAEFACGKCSATFDEPVERPTKPKGQRANVIREVREALGGDTLGGDA